MNIHRNLAGHEPANIWQESTANAADDTKRNSRIPHPLQRLRIRQLTGILRRRNHRLSRTRHHGRCSRNLRGVCHHEVCGHCFVGAGCHCCWADVGGQICGEFVEEDVEVDGCSDAASEEADGEGESAYCSDEFIWCCIAGKSQSMETSRRNKSELTRPE